jgi:hypothetical protein
MLDFLISITYLYYMRLRETKLIALITFLMYTHNECRMRVSAIEIETTPRTEFVNKPS